MAWPTCRFLAIGLLYFVLAHPSAAQVAEPGAHGSGGGFGEVAEDKARYQVVANLFVLAPGNPDLQHNISDLEVTLPDGRVFPAGFLSYFARTGGLTRWGYPTSEVIAQEDGTLVQFFQRGVLDFRDPGSGWVVQRRPTWEFIGGGLGGAPDQGFEPDVINANPGTPLGPWGHRISNFAVDGTETGFADFFFRLGGVETFGYPRTEARIDSGLPGTVFDPDLTPGFIRQYFQAGVLEFHPSDPADPVKLGLVGDHLRDALVPEPAEHQAFQASEPLEVPADDSSGQVFEPYTVPFVEPMEIEAPTIVETDIDELVVNPSAPSPWRSIRSPATTRSTSPRRRPGSRSAAIPARSAA